MRRPTVTRRSMITGMVLVSVFVIAILIRIFPAKYGFFLNEFDPYYDYKAANFIVTSFDQSWKAGQGGFPGLLHYFSWTDYTTWFPEGRSVAATSQDGLQFAGALSYIFLRNVFGLQMSLYDYLVLFPVFVGSLTAIVFYLLVKRIAGEAGGLFAALMIAVSPPLIERGNLGWFKSEPLAIFLFACAGYLFLTLLDSKMTNRQRVFRAVFAGLLAGYANTAWGGGLYFSIAFGLFFVIMPFLNFDVPSLSVVALLFTAGDIFASAIFPRPGIGDRHQSCGLRADRRNGLPCGRPVDEDVGEASGIQVDDGEGPAGFRAHRIDRAELRAAFDGEPQIPLGNPAVGQERRPPRPVRRGALHTHGRRLLLVVPDPALPRHLRSLRRVQEEEPRDRVRPRDRPLKPLHLGRVLAPLGVLLNCSRDSRRNRVRRSGIRDSEAQRVRRW